MPIILVIEDEKPLLEEILTMLRFEDFEVVGAVDGITGVQLAHQHQPDVIICDIMMPELDGYGVLLELQDDPITRKLPFIFLTAKSDREHLRHGMELGADDYITKPFTRDDLLNAIHTRLGKQTSIQDAFDRKLDSLRQSVSLSLPHELRTPLTSLVGFAELLMMDSEVLAPDQVLQMAEAILKAGLRLQRQIENFLLYAQLEMLRLDPASMAALRRNRVTNPGSIIGAVALNLAQAAGRATDLTVKSVNATVQVSEESLSRITDELVGNAIKFSRAGTPIQISTAIENSHYAVMIRDLGRGMSPEQIREAGAYLQFERRLYEQQGSGLGLAIARQMIEIHGGELKIESVLGEGTQVAVQMPLA